MNLNQTLRRKKEDKLKEQKRVLWKIGMLYKARKSTIKFLMIVFSFRV